MIFKGIDQETKTSYGFLGPPRTSQDFLGAKTSQAFRDLIGKSMNQLQLVYSIMIFKGIDYETKTSQGFLGPPMTSYDFL